MVRSLDGCTVFVGIDVIVLQPIVTEIEIECVLLIELPFEPKASLDG